jgi:hypothetical protein
VLLMISVEGEEPQVRTGHIDVLPTSASMRLRSYEGDPAIGLAWTPAVPSKRGFLSSTGEFA